MKIIIGLIKIRILYLILFFVLSTTKLYSQDLTIEETVDYINELIKDGLYSYYKSDDKNEISLSEDGYIHITKKDDGTAYETQYHSTAYKTIGFDFYYDEVGLSKSAENRSISFVCKGWKVNQTDKEAPQCLTLHAIDFSTGRRTISRNMHSWCQIKTKNSHIVEKLYNAFNYLISLMEVNKKYNKDIGDPFAPKKNKSSTSISSQINSAAIPMIITKSTYEVLVNISGIKRKFVFDSGASEISISSDFERILINEGIIRKENYVNSALYKLADGSITERRRFILPKLTVGAFTVRNLIVAVGPAMSPLLLGKAFLDCFSEWSVNNSTRTLNLVK